MFSASAAPRRQRQMRTFPRALPGVAAPFTSSAANALRRRKLGARPSVTKDSAPDLTNALRFMVPTVVEIQARQAPAPGLAKLPAVRSVSVEVAAPGRVRRRVEAGPPEDPPVASPPSTCPASDWWRAGSRRTAGPGGYPPTPDRRTTASLRHRPARRAARHAV